MGVYPIHQLVGAVDLLDEAVVVDRARSERIDMVPGADIEGKCIIGKVVVSIPR